MKNPNTRPQPAEGQELDPLEELARIMNDTNTPNPDKRPEDAPAVSEGDPLDLGLGEQGLEELFQNQSFSNDDLLAAKGVDPVVPESPDELLSTLDFSDLSLPPLDEAALGDQPPVDELPLPPFEATNQQQSPSDQPSQPSLPLQSQPEFEPGAGEPESLPSLTEHLTPRPPAGPQAQTEQGLPVMTPPQSGDVAEEDLLAAMDALALDEPHQAGHAVPPLSSVDMAPEPQSQQPLAEPQAPHEVAPAPAAAPAFDDRQPLAAQGFEDATGFQDNDPGANDRSGVGRKVIYALAGVAVLGLGGVFAFGLFSGDPAGDEAPQLIAAADGDDKVMPEVAGEAPARPGDAAFSALENDGTAGGETPRVVLPSPTNEGLPLQSEQRLPSADIAPAPPGSTASRAVRTVTVRADGTVVESTSEPVPEAPDVAVPALPAAAPRSVETVVVTPGNGPATTSPVQQPLQPVAPGGQAQLQAALEDAAQSATQTTGEDASQTPVGQVADRIAASLAPPQPVARPGVASVETQPVQITPTQPSQPAQPVQSTRQVEPIQLATPAAAPAQPVATQAPAAPQAVAPQAAAPAPVPSQTAALPASVPAGDFIVQLASLRTEEEARATFDRLQNRFGSILSGFSPNIQRADLGDRGIYHRVRLGPMDRAAADNLCSRYQSAGGECFVQRQ